jgi:hypothetical protein
MALLSLLTLCMAVKITHDLPFSAGTRAFRFRNESDTTADLKRYEEGLNLEKARFQSGSLAQRIFDRLSVASVARPAKVAIKKK